jgi:hypothetical protein
MRYRDSRGKGFMTTRLLAKIAELNGKIEAARRAGDTFRLQRLIAQQQRLLEKEDGQLKK